MTTYQKLKAENLKLKRELDIVCNEQNSEDAHYIKGKYIILRAAEKAVFNGNPIGFCDKVIGNTQGIIYSVNIIQ